MQQCKRVVESKKTVQKMRQDIALKDKDHENTERRLGSRSLGSSASGALPLNFHATNPLTHRMTSGFSSWDRWGDAVLMRSLSFCKFLPHLSQRSWSEPGSGNGGKRIIQGRRSFVLFAKSIRDRMSLVTDTSPSVQGRKWK